MYDIHCHIIPNVDDGSGSLSDSVEMAQVAFESGVKGIIATPHCNIIGVYENFWSSDFNLKINVLNEELKKRKIPVKVYPGQEVFVHGDIIELLKSGKLITLNNSRYILTEFDFKTEESEAVSVLERLIAEGYVPIVAHPERYGFVYENYKSLLRMHSIGALFQLNGDSITGNLGMNPMRFSKFILENRLADFVSSDAHSQYSRTPDFTGAHEIVCGYFGYDYAKLIFSDNPFNVINNTEIR